MKYDFSGWATKNDLKCSDGRIIRKDAFKDNDGTVVPLVWQHQHDDPTNVLGHAVLENREDGVYAYCSLNDSDWAQHAAQLIKHGDICSMSIYANRLVQKASDVVHGVIREVSLVLAGANPGALIDNCVIEHSDGSSTEISEEAVIYVDELINTNTSDEIKHSDEADSEETEVEETEEEEVEASEETDESEENQNGSEDTEIAHAEDRTVQEVYDAMSEKKKNVIAYVVGRILEEESDMEQGDTDVDALVHADDSEEESDETIQDVFDSMTEEERAVADYLISQAVKEVESEAEEEEDELEQSDEEGDSFMKHNVFEGGETQENVLSHAELNTMLDGARKAKAVSLREYFKDNDLEIEAVDNTLQHSIQELDVMFPDAKLVGANPELIARPMSWVPVVMNGVKKSPFARIKSVAADITADEARARGYIKGKKKLEEVLTLLKRATGPQTVYKLQKFDRDDVIDITDIDIVAWVKVEMRMMLDEEIARAILVGDGRLTSDDSHIKHENIRPIYHDDDLYTIKYAVDTNASDETEKANAFIDAAVMSRENYMGSGSPVMFTTTKQLNSLLLAKDKIGHRLYANKRDLADALLVRDIIEVPVLAGAERHDDEDTKDYELLALIVDLSDYTVGANRGGEVTLFDDFDIDYNKYEYLIETRISGALTKPYSAIALETEKK